MKFNQYIGFPIRDIRWYVCEEINRTLWNKSYLTFFNKDSMPAELAAGEVHYGIRDKVPQFAVGGLFLDDMGTVEGANG